MEILYFAASSSALSRIPAGAPAPTRARSRPGRALLATIEVIRPCCDQREPVRVRAWRYLNRTDSNYASYHIQLDL